ERGLNQITSSTRHDLKIILIRSTNEIRLARLLTPTLSRPDTTIRINLCECLTTRLGEQRRSRINNTDPNIASPEISNTLSSINIISRVVNRINLDNTTIESGKLSPSSIIS